MSISKETIENVFSSMANKPSKFFRELGKIILDEFSGIRIIGQIERPEGKATYDTLKQCLQSIAGYYGYFDALLDAVLETEQFRSVLSLYFVWTGIFHYGEDEGNELWPHIFKGLSLIDESAIENKFREMFDKCLKENELEQFEQVKEGTVYVTRILLHGLIPKGLMERFIKDIIVPEFSNTKAAYTIGNSIIDKLIRSDTFKNQPKPIQRFIKFGSPINVDVVNKLWIMANNWDNNQKEWRQWGLPKHMVDAFQKWSDTPQFIRLRNQNKKDSATERAYLLFDLEQGSCPLLSVPRQKIEKNSFITVTHKMLKGKFFSEIKDEVKAYPIGNELYSDTLIEISPSNEWKVMITSGEYSISFEQTVCYDFPEGDSGKCVPFFLFNSKTGKSVRNNSYPTELVIIYPLEAYLDLNKGGSVLTEPIRLSGKWRDWQYIHCELEKEGTFHYKGPDINLHGKIEETISFRKQFPDPILKSQKQIPSWIRCSDDFLQIITDTEGLQLFFNHERYVSGELIRLDSSYQRTVINRFPLRYQNADNGKIVILSDTERIKMGVYEINLHGKLGVEDFTIPFLYLPIEQHERILSEDSQVADSFIVNFTEDIPVKLFDDRTNIYFIKSNELKIYLKEDSGDAYCALKIFPDSFRPVVLLFARTDIRWVRRSEEGLLEWKFWRSKFEEIPVQRLDEIEDSRVLIEIDQPLKTDKPKIVLKDQTQKGTQNEVLLTDNAKNFKRNNRHVWIINLKKYSDQLKSLKNSQQADIIYKEKDERILFSLLRFPEFENFQVESFKTDENSEQIKITWTPHPNEPKENRKLRFYSADSSDPEIIKSIKNNEQPPIIIDLKSPEKTGIWIAEIDIQRSRFGVNRFASTCSSKVHTQWFRMPSKWADWLEYPAIRPDEIIAKYSMFENLITDKVKRTSLTWIYFLHLFHYGIDENSHQELALMLGDAFIRDISPFFSDTIWDIKVKSKIHLRLKVVSSTINSDDIFKKIKPYQWYHLPEKIEIRLSMMQSNIYLGERGNNWIFSKLSDKQEPTMESISGVLESRKFRLSQWLKLAIEPCETGFIAAKIPIESMWDNPPLLPVLKENYRNDSVFINVHVEKRKSVKSNDNSPFKSAFAEHFSQNSQTENNDLASDLMERWIKWADGTNINPLLGRIIRGRLESCPVNIITGAAAFIFRLKANGYDFSIYKNSNLKFEDKNIEQLLSDTLKFVSDFLPKSFLRDLIISETLINWYWNKTIYESSMSECSEEELKHSKTTTTIQTNSSANKRKIEKGTIRKKPCRFSDSDVKRIWIEYGFFDSTFNRKASFINKFIDNNNDTITDQATGLMWQKDGSSKKMKWSEADNYVKDLNQQRFAGFSDWRLSSLEELGTLMKSTEKRIESQLYAHFIDPIFSKKQAWCWSSDNQSHNMLWFISFNEGTVKIGNTSFRNYVKAVRSEELKNSIGEDQ